MSSEEENHEDFFNNLQNFGVHFSEALSDDDEPDLSLYTEVMENKSRYGDLEFLDKGGMKTIFSSDDNKTARKSSYS